ITALIFTFSKPLETSRAQDLGNYGYYVFSGGPTGVFSAADVYTSIRSAVYDAGTRTVTVTPSAPLPLNSFFRIVIDRQPSLLLHNVITDRANTQLAGSNGFAGTPFAVTFAAGSNLTYTDTGGNGIQLRLKRGGVMEMFRAASGDVQQLQLAGTIVRKSVLSG